MYHMAVSRGGSRFQAPNPRGDGGGGVAKVSKQLHEIENFLGCGGAPFRSVGGLEESSVLPLGGGGVNEVLFYKKME